MAELDLCFKMAARSSGREMCRLRDIRPQVWEPISDTLQTTERLADRAFRATQDGESFVVYFEAYTTWRAAARWNILAKRGLLSERERLPTVTLVFLLTPDGYSEQNGTFHLAARGRSTQQIWFYEICLWREQPEPWWEQVPGLMALLPLCNHGRGDKEVVQHAAQNITAQVADMNVRGDLLASLGIFGKLIYPQLDVVGLIGRENMRESPLYQEIMAEGDVARARADILHVLKARFGAEAPAKFAQALKVISDSEQLSELLSTAATCPTVDGFRDSLGVFQA